MEKSDTLHGSEKTISRYPQYSIVISTGLLASRLFIVWWLYDYIVFNEIAQHTRFLTYVEHVPDDSLAIHVCIQVGMLL